MKRRHFRQASVLAFLSILITTLACVSNPNPPQPELAASEILPATHTASPSETPTPSEVPPPTGTPTITPTPSPSPTATISPTYAILRGKVLVRANCRYGPGAPYLYKYGLVPGSNLEVIGRNDLGTWILVQAIGGNNPCWVKASLMEVKGDVLSVQPTYIPLPASPYYRPPTGVSAVRNGDEVTISWNPITLRAGDDSGQVPYVIEAWVCLSGQLVFTPLGSYGTTVTISDEAGCAEPSSARLMAAEKHGYTRWVEIPWP